MDANGSIDVHSAILSFPSVYIVAACTQVCGYATDVAPMVVASSGSHKVVGPSTEEKRTMIKKLILAGNYCQSVIS